MSSRTQIYFALCLVAALTSGCSALAVRQSPAVATLSQKCNGDDSDAAILICAGTMDEPADLAKAFKPTSAAGCVAVSTSPRQPLAVQGTGGSSELTAGSTFSFDQDWQNLGPEFFDNVDRVCTDQNLCILLIAAGASWTVHETLDDTVADNTERHKNRWGKGQDFFAGISNPGHHFAAIGGLYLYSLHAQDAEVHDLSKSLFYAVSITGLSTMFLKGTMGLNTTAPNGEQDPFGGAWPSGHTSSAFTVAAVLDEYYGPRIGVPAFLLAGLSGWERIDDREHDLSDVIFGAVLGYVIGKSVAADHGVRVCGMELQPLADPVSGTTGVCLERRF